jgi:hypothetical protein
MSSSDIFIGGFGLLIGLYILAMILAWPVNAYQFTQCDFEAPLNCEATRLLGVLVPITAPFTAFADTDEEA